MQQQWFMVKVHPNAGKDMLVALAPNRYEAWVKAKPIEGWANDAVSALLAKHLAIPPSQLRLVKGHQGRQKLFTVIA